MSKELSCAPAVPVREGPDKKPLAVEGLGERATKWRGGYCPRGQSLLARGLLLKMAAKEFLRILRKSLQNEKVLTT